MSNPVTFFSHLTTGLLADAAGLPVDGNLEATFHLQVTTGPDGGAQAPIPRTVAFYRPCDVLGISAKAVRRTDPSFKEYNSEFEPNYLPLIEFVEADLPWRFTSDPGTPQKRTSWVALLVLAAGEFKMLEPSRDQVEDVTGKKVVRPPIVEILDPSALPPVSEVGLWAHVQAEGQRPNASANQLEVLNKASPFGLISRLVAARRLAPHTTYTAFVVPTYECGRLRGLNPDALHEHSTALAWENAAAGHELPVYFSWSFSTSEYGDIEALAERLEGRGLDPDTGTRPLQSALQEYNVPAAAPHRRYEGAIVSTEIPPHPAQAGEITDRLVEVLNWPSDLRAAAGAGDPLADPKALAPPIYGSWHLPEHRVAAGDPTWVSRLNTQLHLRAVAGLGAEVVRRDQEDLMAEAWRQVGDVAEAGRRLCAAQLGYLTTDRLYDMATEGLSPETLLFMTRPVHAKLRNAGITTLSQELEATNLRGVTKSARLRSMLAPNSVAQKYLPVDANSGAAIDPLTSVIQSVAAAESIKTTFEPEVVDQAMAAVIEEAPAETGGAPGGFVGGAAGGFVARDFTTPIDDPGGGGGFVPPDESFDPGVIHEQPGTTQPVGPVDLGEIHDEILGALDPAITIPGRINELIDGIEVSSPEALCDAIMPAPEFTTPMYEPLRNLSVSHLMPGIGDIPPNTVSVLQANTEFIEAYMAGLNFEMAAELLWRGYPTEMRATFFKHFWESGGQNTGIAQMKDWHSSLGSNIPGDPPPLILLIRGDIIRRYPGIFIYAKRAGQADGQVILTGDAVVPDFRADLTTDTVALGFADLSEEDVRGSAQHPDGYFFVLEERERDVRLGLDEPEGDTADSTDWNEVTWADVAPTSFGGPGKWAGPINLSLPNQSNTLPADPAWGAAAAGMATLLYQKPFRIALHARRLLPPDTQP